MQKRLFIRPAEIGDAPFVATVVEMALDEETLIGYCGPAYHNVLIQLASLEVSQYSFRNAFIAEMDGRPVGGIVLYDGALLSCYRVPTLNYIQEVTGLKHETPDETEAGEYYIDSLAVVAEFRGLGIACQLIEYVKVFALEKEARKLGLLVDEERPVAMALYGKCGFKIVGYRNFLDHQMVHMQLDIM